LASLSLFSFLLGNLNDLDLPDFEGLLNKITDFMALVNYKQCV
jgi:hypothetical protein